MIVPPVITRELRAESRNPMNWWLRVLGATVLALVLTALLINIAGQRQMDPIVFPSLHTTVVVLIWLLVPAMTADCIAREKREGTLGLLFLTPLTSREVILGKAFVHFQRAFTLLLAAVPMITVPLLLGGVSGADLLSACCGAVSSMLLALSAGIVASACCKSSVRALLLAEVLAGVAFIGACYFSALQLSIFWSYVTPTMPVRMPSLVDLLFGGGRWSQTWSTWGTASAFRSFNAAGLVIASGLVFFLALVIAARQIRRTWQEKPLSPRQAWLVKVFCTPQIWQSLFRRRMTRALDTNPISWLQQYSWSARLSKWGWCLVIVVFECIAPFTHFMNIQWMVAVILIIGLTFMASGSFRQERQNGALELLLVTPLREGQIIFGRLWGVWKQMLPSTLLFFFVALSFGVLEPYQSLTWLPLVGSCIVCVPVIGLYFSLRLKNYLVSWIVTIITSVFMPYFLVLVIAFGSQKLYMPVLRQWEDALEMMILLQVAVAIWAATRLLANLKRRTFALSST